ncbi:hypothetical protein AB4K05_19355 [Kluyvera sp. STS39-E]|uniref:hypothetical protein n=1 Tax=Kluyvera sp. STS39-E TaxID=3234748 RepID=UPI0034C6A59C
MTVYLKTMKRILLLLALFSAPAWALDFSSTILRLNCPSRGLVQITLHVYGHVSELWKGNYEVGGGHRSHNGVDLVKFTNGDQFIHNSNSNEFMFRYAGKKALQHCHKLSENRLTVQTLPYHH